MKSPFLNWKNYFLMNLIFIGLLITASLGAYASADTHLYLELGEPISEIPLKLEGDLDQNDEQGVEERDLIEAELTQALRDALVHINLDTINSKVSCLRGLHIHQMSDSYKRTNLFLQTDRPQQDNSKHLRLSVKNKQQIRIEIEISFIEGRFAFQPFFFDEKRLNHETKNIAWYILDNFGGEGTGFGENLRVMSIKDYNKWINNSTVRREYHDHIVNHFKKILHHQFFLISCLNPLKLEQRIAKIKNSLTQVAHDEEPNWAQIILDAAGEETNYLLIGRWDDFHRDVKNSYVAIPQIPKDIPYSHETRAITGNLALNFVDKDNFFFNSKRLAGPQYKVEDNSNIEGMELVEHRSQVIARIHKLRNELNHILKEYDGRNRLVFDTESQKIQSDTNIKFSNTLNRTPFRGDEKMKRDWKRMIHTYVLKNQLSVKLEECDKNWLYYFERKLTEVKDRLEESISS